MFIPPKFVPTIAFILSWDHGKSQEKMETMFMQNFGRTNKEYYGIFESGLLRSFLFQNSVNRTRPKVSKICFFPIAKNLQKLQPKWTHIATYHSGRYQASMASPFGLLRPHCFCKAFLLFAGDGHLSQQLPTERYAWFLSLVATSQGPGSSVMITTT